jgi:hypothetical protein
LDPHDGAPSNNYGVSILGGRQAETGDPCQPSLVTMSTSKRSLEREGRKRILVYRTGTTGYNCSLSVRARHVVNRGPHKSLITPQRGRSGPPSCSIISKSGHPYLQLKFVPIPSLLLHIFVSERTGPTTDSNGTEYTQFARVESDCKDMRGIKWLLTPSS